MRKFGCGADQLFAFRHRFTDERRGVGPGGGRGVADQRMRAVACFAQRGGDLDEAVARGIADFGETLGLPRQQARDVARTCGGIRHDHFDMALRVGRQRLELLGFGRKTGNRFFECGAFVLDRRIESLAFVTQFLQQIVHLRTVALVTAEHKFGARHGGVGHLFDLLGVLVEFDGDGVGRLGRGFDGSAEIARLFFERAAGGVELAFRSFHDRLQLRDPAREMFACLPGGAVERAFGGFDHRFHLSDAGGDKIVGAFGALGQQFVGADRAVEQHVAGRSDHLLQLIDLACENVVRALRGRAEGFFGGLHRGFQFLGAVGKHILNAGGRRGERTLRRLDGRLEILRARDKRCLNVCGGICERAFRAFNGSPQFAAAVGKDIAAFRG